MLENIMGDEAVYLWCFIYLHINTVDYVYRQ